MIENVIISDNDELNEIDISKLPSDFVFGAINVNHDEHAYCKVRFDPVSIEWFKENLYLVSHMTTRGAIWRHLWTLVIDKKMKSLHYLDFVQKQIVHESCEHIVSWGLLNLSVLIDSYLPVEVIDEKAHSLFETLIQLLQKEGITKDPIVDRIFSFLSHKEHIQNALGWLESNKITVGDASLYELKTVHKHSILRCLFASRHFEYDIKIETMEMVFGEDKSDQTDRCRATCMASLPDP